MPRTVLFHGGRVFTGRRYVEALVIEDGRVLAAGTSGEVRGGVAAGTERVDLAGALAIPALVDAHVHVAELARRRAGPDLEGASSVEQLRIRLTHWADDHPQGPVVGRGFELAARRPGAWPDVRELDRALPDRPVVLWDASGHVAMLNSAALARVAAVRNENDPALEGVGRYEDGRPNGILLESAARRFAARAAGEEGPDPAAGRSTLAALAARGVAAVGAMNVSAEELAWLDAAVRDDPRLPRVRAFVSAPAFRAGATGASAPASDRIAVVGVKGFLDGAFGPRTAALVDAYTDLPGAVGTETLDEDSAVGLVADVVAHGLMPALHAIGDRAVGRAARIYGSVGGLAPGRARIEHASLVPPAVLTSLLASRPVLAVQPGFLLTDTWLDARLGPARARWAYPFRTLLRAGVALAGSSDAPFGPLDPWEGIRAAIARHDAAGRSANREPAERLSAEAALALYTSGAAAALGEPGAGSLEAGGRADLAVLGAPSLVGAVGLASPVVQTWIDGALVFSVPA